MSLTPLLRCPCSCVHMQPPVALLCCTSGSGAVPASSLPADWRGLHAAHQLRTFLCVPLIQAGGKVVGTLTLASGDGESWLMVIPGSCMQVVSHPRIMHACW